MNTLEEVKLEEEKNNRMKDKKIKEELTLEIKKILLLLPLKKGSSY